MIYVPGVNKTIVLAEALRRDKPRPKVALTDCLAYKRGECRALDDLYCRKEECNFYKWKE